MPNISFIARKPKPLGTEFKTIVDGLAGQIIWMEIQEEKELMSRKEF